MKKPPGTALIIGIGGRKPAAAEEAEDESPSKEGKAVAAAEVMAALKSGDKEAFAEALESFVGMCSSAEEE